MALTRNQMRTQLLSRGIVRVLGEYDGTKVVRLVSFNAAGVATEEAIGHDTIWPFVRDRDIEPRSGSVEWDLTPNTIRIFAEHKVYGYDQIWVA